MTGRLSESARLDLNFTAYFRMKLVGEIVHPQGRLCRHSLRNSGSETEGALQNRPSFYHSGDRPPVERGSKSLTLISSFQKNVHRNIVQPILPQRVRVAPFGDGGKTRIIF